MAEHIGREQSLVPLCGEEVARGTEPGVGHDDRQLTAREHPIDLLDGGVDEIEVRQVEPNEVCRAGFCARALCRVRHWGAARGTDHLRSPACETTAGFHPDTSVTSGDQSELSTQVG